MITGRQRKHHVLGGRWSSPRDPRLQLGAGEDVTPPGAWARGVGGSVSRWKRAQAVQHTSKYEDFKKSCFEVYFNYNIVSNTSEIVWYTHDTICLVSHKL